MKALSYPLFVTFVIILVIGALGLLARHFGSLEWIMQNESQLSKLDALSSWAASGDSHVAD